MSQSSPEQKVEQWHMLEEDRLKRLARGFLYLLQRSEEMADRSDPMLVLRAAHEYTGTVEVPLRDAVEFVNEAIKADFIDESAYKDQLHQPRVIGLSLLELSHEERIGSNQNGRSFIHPDLTSDEPEAFLYVASDKPRL